jgi:hypothetical protein
MVVVVMIVVLIAFLAAYAVSRIKGGTEDGGTTTTRLAKAAEALEAFAAAAQRLPCPADPAIDSTTTPADANDGLERVDPANNALCTYPEGTLPWRTIGMKRDDALDAWGRKLSYRVYTGNNGSLTQPGGVSMVNCDTIEPSPGGKTATASSAGGLCNGSADLYTRSTTPAQFLDNKGLSLTDGTLVRTDVAYVIISHGATGLGGYTVSGARLDMPAGDERNNTRDTGAFTIKAFSDVDVAATNGQHFDDLLAYRALPDLVKRINLADRNWPELAGVDASLAFTSAIVSAAAGQSVARDSALGRDTLSFSGVRVTGRTSGAASELGFGDPTYDGIGVAGGGSNKVQSGANESVRLDLDAHYQKFGVTLADFGAYGFLFLERVQFDFYLNGAVVGSPVTAFACSFDGGLASFSITPTSLFDRVDVTPLPAIDFVGGGTGTTEFLVSEVKACPASSPTCRTTADDGSASARCL